MADAAAGPPDPSASGTATATATGGGAGSIRRILQSRGPTVKCVLLRHIMKDGKDCMPHVAVVDYNNNNNNNNNGHKYDPHAIADAVELSASSSAKQTSTTTTTSKLLSSSSASPAEAALTPPPSPRVASSSTHHRHQQQHQQHHREVLSELIDEIEVDTTPQSNSGVRQALGGPFTFLGQYEDEGVVLIVRAGQVDDLDRIETMSVRELEAILKDAQDAAAAAAADGNNSERPVEKSDLVDAVRSAQLPANPHKLQPPFHKHVVRGDILIMRVGGHDDEEDDEDDDQVNDVEKAIANFSSASAVSNEEFFLNYTKDEYIRFASRTDIVAAKTPTTSGGDEEAEGDEEDEEEEEEEWQAEEFDEDEDANDEEEERVALLNLILGEVIKKFRLENGRGPDSEELLGLRSQVAAKLGMKMDAPVVIADDDGKKRAAVDPLEPSASNKKVKFTTEVAADASEVEDKKPAAVDEKY